MESDDLAGAAALRWSDSGWTDSGSTDAGWPDDEPPARRAAAADAAAAVAALYDDAAVGLIRLAYLMLGDRPSAEDVVQDAFFGLYRNWARLADHDRALAYVRSSVLNGCRSALRRRAAGRRLTLYQPPAASAEAAALGREERREVMQAVRRLPGRQREALVLRFYLDLPEAEIARIMGLRPSSVRSATHRALKALGLSLGEGS
jgi:RNA polymerase sigma-70 factor (sigma-E family)